MYNPFEDPETSYRGRYAKLLPLLEQSQARLVLGADAKDVIEHGFPDGIDIIARAADVDPATVRQGLTELNERNTPTN